MKHKTILFLTFLFGVLAFLSFVNATGTGTVSITTPASGATLTGAFAINVTNVSFGRMLNCTFTLGSVSTGNTSVSAGIFLNDTLFRVNGTYTGTQVEDSNDYVLTASCRNTTNNEATATATGLIIQNTYPEYPTITAPTAGSQITSAQTVTFSSTVTNRKTTGCTYSIGRGGATSGGDYSSGTGTYSSASCSFTKAFSTSADNGKWYFTLTASDGTDTNASSSNFDVAITPVSGGLPGGETSSEGTATSGTSPIIIALIIIISVIVFIKLASK